MALVAHYLLNDALATTNVLASVGTDGTLIGGNNTTDLSEAGKINNALHFDGTNDYVDIGMQSFSAAQGSIAIWIKSDSNNPSTNKYIVGRNAAGNVNGDIAIWIRDSDNKLGFFIQNGSTTFNAYADNAFADTNWHWVVAVWSSTEVAIYVDNVKQSVPGTGTTLAAHASVKFSIGSLHGASASEAWDGLLDDVRIYTHLLDTDERAFVYNSGNGTEVAEDPGVVTNSTTINSDSAAIGSNSTTITSDSYVVLETNSATLSSDSGVAIQYFATLNSNSSVEGSNSASITSDTVVALSLPENIQGIDIAISDTDEIFIVQAQSSTELWKVTNLEATDTPDFEQFILNLSDEDFANGTAISLNNTLNAGYIACTSGQVCKFDLTNPLTRELIDLSDTDYLLDIDVIPDFALTFTNTVNADAEMYKVDEATTKSLNTKLSFLLQIKRFLTASVTFIFGRFINLDLRFKALAQRTLNMKLTFLSSAYSTNSALTIAALVVELDGVALPDIMLQSCIITRVVDDSAIAEFTLPRYFDRPDYTVDGVLSQISNQNVVEIKFNSIRLFYGTIQSFSSDANNESIVVLAKTSENIEDEYDPSTMVDMPIATLNEQQHIYHLIVDGVNVEKQSTDTRAIITGGNKFWTGSDWSIRRSASTTFASFALADAYIEARESNDLFMDAQPQVDNYEASPAVYLGVRTYLGVDEEEVVTRYIDTSTLVDEEIEEFKPEQNWTYFYTLVSATKYIQNSLGGFSSLNMSGYYLGSSLGSLSGEIININSVSFRRQRAYSNQTEDLGYYEVGSAPFKIVSSANGRYTARYQWEDREDGLYNTRGTSRDYVDFATQIANWEYDRLKNINGDLTPRVSLTAKCTIDAMLFYKLNLLTRLNVTSTTQSGVFKNTNGFPVSIKSLSIDFSDMSVALSCDNAWSEYELGVNYPEPDQPNETEAYAVRMFRKYDVLNQKFLT